MKKKRSRLKLSYPDINLRKLKSRIEKLEDEKELDILKGHYIRTQVERSNLNSYLALILSITSLIFSIWG